MAVSAEASRLLNLAGGRTDVSRESARAAMLRLGVPWLVEHLAEVQPSVLVRTDSAVYRLDAMRAELSSVIVCLRSARADLRVAADLLLDRGHAWLGEPLALWLVDDREKAVDILLERVPRYDWEDDETDERETPRETSDDLLRTVNDNRARAEAKEARRATAIRRAQCRELLARLSRLAVEMCAKMRCEILNGTQVVPWALSYKYISEGVKPNPSSAAYPSWWYPDELGTEGDFPEFMVAWGTDTVTPWIDGPRHSSVIVAIRRSTMPEDWSASLRAAVARPCPAVMPCTPTEWIDRAVAAAAVRNEQLKKEWPGRNFM